MPQRVDFMIQKFQKTEQIFVPTYKEKTSTINLKNFILQNFKMPNNDLERICNFISHDRELEKIIFELPNLIKNEVSFDKLQIKFYDEFQDDYLQLEVSIFTSTDIADSLKIEDKLEKQLYELYNSESADKLLIIMEC